MTYRSGYVEAKVPPKTPWWHLRRRIRFAYKKWKLKRKRSAPYRSYTEYDPMPFFKALQEERDELALKVNKLNQKNKELDLLLSEVNKSAKKLIDLEDEDGY